MKYAYEIQNMKDYKDCCAEFVCTYIPDIVPDRMFDHMDYESIVNYIKDSKYEVDYVELDDKCYFIIDAESDDLERLF